MSLQSTVLSLVSKAFESAWKSREYSSENNKRSSYFVSQLSKEFSEKFQGEALVQETSKDGKKKPGEWLLDIAIVAKAEVSTTYKNRKATIVKRIKWAIESEFSTNLNEFCKDFSKLLHIKSEAYLYIAGLNQIQKESRKDYINSQIDLARKLVEEHMISEPFFLVFIPTPGKSGRHNSVWDKYNLDELRSWFRIINLSS